MNKLAVIWLVIGIGIGAIMFQGELVQLSEAIYSIPPTAAWSTITLNDTIDNVGVNFTAQEYNRQLEIKSDGSIILELGN